MQRAYDRLVAFLQILTAALGVLLLGVVLVGLFYRYIVDQALVWYDEFAGYLLVWVTMAGSVVALAKRKHISFDTLVERMGPRARRGVEVFGILCVMSFSLVLLVSGWVLVREMADDTAISVPAVRMGWVYSIMPISGGLMLLVGLVQLVGALGPRAKDVERAAPMEEAQ